MDIKTDSLWLMQGDCLERMKEIPDGSVDMILTDPPYGTTACKWDSIIPLEPMWEQLKRIIKPNGAIVMTASQPFTSILISSNIKMFKYNWVWDKVSVTGHLNAKKMPLRRTEDICVFYRKTPTYNPQMTSREKPRRTRNTNNHSVFGNTKDVFVSDIVLEKKYPVNLIQFSKGSKYEKMIHPTAKPVALMEYLIKTYTNENETVLDFTMGSGSTGVAAKNLNRKFIGIELDDGYFEIAKNRINGE